MKFYPFLVFFVAILLGLFYQNHASANPIEYVCAAKVDCGAPSMPSTQDLPALDTPTVKSTTPELAKTECMNRYLNSYLRLAKVIDEGKSCQVLSEAFPAQTRKISSLKISN